MKVLHIINSLATGGAEKLLLETLPLYNQEIQADLLLLNGKSTPFLVKLKDQDCCRIHSLGNLSVYNPLNIFKIVPYLRRYDLIHVHLFPAQYWVVLAKLISLTKVKLVFTEHNTSNRRIASRIYGKIDRLVYRFYYTIICITSEVKDIFIGHIKRPSSVFKVIENGVNIKAIQHANSYPKDEIDDRIAPTDKVIMQVAGFREQKDQMTVIKAMTLLSENVKLVLVGDGVLKEACKTLAKELHVRDRVIFLGIRGDVPQLLKSSDIVVMSSIWEGFGLAAVEGMAAAKPVIASDIPGLGNIVQGAGILFPVGAYRQLAEEIKELIENKDYYESVAKACEKRAANYDIRKMVDQHLKLYEHIVKA